MNAPAHLGQAVAYSHMLAGTGVAMDVAHAAFEAQLVNDDPDGEPSRVMTTAEKRAALAAGMRARGETSPAATTAGTRS